MKTLHATVYAVMLCLLVSQASSAAPAPAATLGSAQAEFDKGDYRACLSKITQALPTAKKDSPERFDLLLLRAECMLRVKQRHGAVTAIEAAIETAKRQRDLGRAAKATALDVLVEAAAPGFTYPPKKAAARPADFQVSEAEFDITETASRQKAMGLLLEDLRARVQPRIDQALDDTSLKSTDAVLRAMWELYSVEQAATGDTADTSRKLEALADHARELLQSEVKRLVTRLDQLEDLAGEATWVNDTGGIRGLRSDERKELEQMTQDLAQIQSAGENARRIARLFGRTGEKWDPLLAECADARDSAQRAHDRRY